MSEKKGCGGRQIIVSIVLAVGAVTVSQVSMASDETERRQFGADVEASIVRFLAPAERLSRINVDGLRTAALGDLADIVGGRGNASLILTSTRVTHDFYFFDSLGRRNESEFYLLPPDIRNLVDHERGLQCDATVRLLSSLMVGSGLPPVTPLAFNVALEDGRLAGHTIAWMRFPDGQLFLDTTFGLIFATRNPEWLGNIAAYDDLSVLRSGPANPHYYNDQGWAAVYYERIHNPRTAYTVPGQPLYSVAEAIDPTDAWQVGAIDGSHRDVEAALGGWLAHLGNRWTYEHQVYPFAGLDDNDITLRFALLPAARNDLLPGELTVGLFTGDGEAAAQTIALSEAEGMHMSVRVSGCRTPAAVVVKLNVGTRLPVDSFSLNSPFEGFEEDLGLDLSCGDQLL